jgi:hypothetical protein
MDSPGTQIDIMKLKLLVAGIELEFDFNKAVIIYCFQEALAIGLKRRILSRHNVCAGPAKFERALAPWLYKSI